MGSLERLPIGSVPSGKLLTTLSIPSAIVLAPKFKRSPSGKPVSLRYVSSWRPWIRPVCSRRFQLEHETTFHDEVDTVRSWNDHSFVHEVHGYIDLQEESALREFVREARRVRRLETSWPDATMHSHAAADDRSCYLVLIEFVPHARPGDHRAYRRQVRLNPSTQSASLQFPPDSLGRDNAGIVKAPPSPDAKAQGLFAGSFCPFAA